MDKPVPVLTLEETSCGGRRVAEGVAAVGAVAGGTVWSGVWPGAGAGVWAGAWAGAWFWAQPAAAASSRQSTTVFKLDFTSSSFSSDVGPEGGTAKFTRPHARTTNVYAGSPV